MKNSKHLSTCLSDDIFNKIATPESVGIPSKAVLGFIDELKKEGLCIHGFSMMKSGKVFTEGYYAPFHVDFEHRVYSVTKSFTSLAIGLLQEEGKLSLSDPICDYFPDKLPEGEVHPYLAMTTIRDMLLMATPHRYTTFKQLEIDDWVKTFFVVEPNRYPGKCFCYDTSSSHVLAALVERLSGKAMLDYLKEKLLIPLGCSKGIKILKDPVGVSQGGSGLLCTVRDLTKVAYTCMNKGVYQGVQLLPADYLKEATSFQISTCLQPVIEEQQGYGYQFWRCRNNGFALYGIGGQLAICLPEYDFMLVTVADTLSVPNGVQGIYEALWHQILPYLKDREQMPLTEDALHNDKLLKTLRTLKVSTVEGLSTCAIVPDINGSIYELGDNPMLLSSCCFKLQNGEKEGSFLYTNPTGTHQLEFGFGSMKQQKFPDTEYDCISSAAWVTENTLQIRTSIIDECFSSVNMSFTFEDNTITIAMKKGIEPFLALYDGFASGGRLL
ncbi:serine hydrolase [Anaerocolumna sp. AGMB13020]|uniref:serine hydrolase domain-containing protein n=1 Tax=Anaerocolumna sp. AGMB13020 TaxID=3081750 RepID=UPI00295532F8|nr:serine hydrolase [Anaerocolumna sp. AGMB13020]WOO38718.1 serine hydrolase [Anaerocolumna sp. AGMB13020]